MLEQHRAIVAELIFGEKPLKRRCPCCKVKIDPTKFRDQESAREYAISGLCQKCQDSSFGKQAGSFTADDFE